MIRRNQDDEWNVCNGDTSSNNRYTTKELEVQYTMNTAYFMLPHDNKRLISNGYKSDRRRKNKNIKNHS